MFFNKEEKEDENNVILVLKEKKYKNPFFEKSSLDTLNIHIKDLESIPLLKRLYSDWKISKATVDKCCVFLDDHLQDKHADKITEYFLHDNSLFAMIQQMRELYAEKILQKNKNMKPYIADFQTAMLDFDIADDIVKRFFIK